MNKCVLIQANGDGVRMKDYFNIAKHHLFYKGARIIEQIVCSVDAAGIDCYIATKYTENVMLTSIHCKDTKNRIETLAQCLDTLASYDTIIVHDCDVLFNYDTIEAMEGNMISVAHYKGDGLKYGFIEVDKHFQYKWGNEKRKETEYIAAGLYSFETKLMKQFIEKNNGLSYDSLLEYYNMYKPNLLYTNSHINLGDIDSYMNNL
jgi:NDP-sugar pyrophosphorylase family protein